MSEGQPPTLDYADPRPPGDANASAEESITLGYATGLILLPCIPVAMSIVRSAVAAWGLDSTIQVLVLDIIGVGCGLVLVQRLRGKHTNRDVKNGGALVLAIAWIALCIEWTLQWLF